MTANISCGNESAIQRVCLRDLCEQIMMWNTEEQRESETDEKKKKMER